MNVVRFRPSVQIAPLNPIAVHLLAALETVANDCQTDLLVTCGSEDHALHSETDPHSRGEALDVGAADLPPVLVLVVKQHLDATLGPAFTVLYEVPSLPPPGPLRGMAYVNPHATGPHFHLQVKIGQRWP